jgi:uncharacterized membrane protein HdeD (DUF308 family)
VNEEHKGAPDSPRVSELEGLREMSVYLLTMGIALIALGVIAIGSSFVAGLATMLVFGLLLLLGAIFEVVTAFWGRHWRGFFLHMLAGVLYLIAGLFMIDRPVAAEMALTLLVAACLLVGGILRIVVSLVERFEGWGWSLLNGVVSLLLGAVIWRQWPLSSLWFIGLFVGIEMLFSGLSWVMLALAVRSARKAVLAA